MKIYLDKIDIRRVIFYLYIWLMLGFTLGSLTLIYIVRAVIDHLRTIENKLMSESMAVVIIIASLVIVSWLLTIVFVKWHNRPRQRVLKNSGVVLISLFAVLSFKVWLNPYGFVSNIKGNFIVGKFVAGRFPSQDVLYRLKREGYTAVVSLLNPTYVPFEGVLIKREREMAAKAGIKLIEIPTLPWLSKNTDAVKKIQELQLAPGHQKYYIHCYLGFDRTRFMLLSVKQALITQAEINFFLLKSGYVFTLKNKLAVIPTLTQDEFSHIILTYPNPYLNFKITHLVFLNADRDSLFFRSVPKQQLLVNYGITEENIDFSVLPYKPEQLLMLVNRLKNLKGAVAMLVDKGVPESQEADAFLLVYITGRPAFPLLFFKGLTNGDGSVIAPNVAIGPAPTEKEFSGYLKNRGVTGLIYFGACQGDSYIKFKSLARLSQYQWVCTQSDQAIFKATDNNGLYYLFGPLANENKKGLEAGYFKRFTPLLQQYYKKIYLRSN